MSTTVPIIVAINAANAAANAARERRAREHCQAIMPAYHDAGSTIEQRHEYASCVDRMYPQDSAAGAVAFAVFVALMLAVCGWLFWEMAR